MEVGYCHLDFVHTEVFEEHWEFLTYFYDLLAWIGYHLSRVKKLVT